ncbi:putative small GTPase of Rho family [Neocallimastix californiae]|uniref:Putative small GTPase of Rho family n=1 Tax=Neocallimastix californiae TaxID=1754190 RepID=A0A1Y2EX22_9FUNG|nr:putative small GTPase of Rho family [Neocallimastix californiae]|eukprot:ORY76162.1 putative small GTPase of Rho family [Neocallimastix californiae]
MSYNTRRFKFVTSYNTHRRKLVIVGDGGCSKTCLLIVYVLTVFKNYVADVEIYGGHVEIVLWDTGGQEDYDRFKPLDYSESNVILICFSVDSPDSLDNVKEKCISKVLHFCPYVPIILVGCKKDLRNDPIVIDKLRKSNQQPGKSVAEEIGACRYMECSAKDRNSQTNGVREVFELAAYVAREINYMKYNY